MNKFEKHIFKIISGSLENKVVEIIDQTKTEIKFIEVKVLPEDIKKLYRILAKKHHPDNKGHPEAMKAINEFYEQLKNLKK